MVVSLKMGDWRLVGGARGRGTYGNRHPRNVLAIRDIVVDYGFRASCVCPGYAADADQAERNAEDSEECAP